MIENLSWNAQKEGRFRTNAFLGSRSGSQLAKNSLLPRHVDVTCPTTSIDCKTGLSLSDRQTRIRNFLDSGHCEMPKADGREKIWVSYEQNGIAVDASSSSVQNVQSSGSFFGVASIFGNEIPIYYLKKHSS